MFKRLSALVLCIIMVFGAVSCKNDQNNEGGSTTTVSPDEQAKIAYEEILEHYSMLVSTRAEGKELPTCSDESDELSALHTIVAGLKQLSDPSSVGYVLRDIDGNGAEELIIKTKVGSILAIYTLDNKVPKLLTKPEGYGYISQDGLITWRCDTENSTRKNAWILIDGALVGTEYGSDDGQSYYKIVDGERKEMSKEEYRALENIYVDSTVFFRGRYALRFIPIVKGEENKNAKHIDIKSYDDVIALFKDTIKLYPKFSEMEWRRGVYDDKFTFADNNSFIIYNEMMSFRRSEHSESFYGYIKLDVNSDGVEELMLMNERYGILALFTMKNGVPTVFESGSGGISIGVDGKIINDYYSDSAYYEHKVYSIDKERGFVKEDHFGWGYGVTLPIAYTPTYFSVDDKGYYTETSSEEYTSRRDGIYEGESISFRNQHSDKYVSLGEPVAPYVAKLKRHSSSILNEEAINITSVENGNIAFTLGGVERVGGIDIFTPYTEVTATLKDGKYRFDNGEVSGSIEFGVISVWVNVEKSNIQNIKLGYGLYSENGF